MLLKNPRGEPFFPLCCLLVASAFLCVAWLVAASLQSLPLSSHGFFPVPVCGLPSTLRTPVIEFKVYLNPVLPHLNKLHLQGACLQKQPDSVNHRITQGHYSTHWRRLDWAQLREKLMIYGPWQMSGFGQRRVWISIQQALTKQIVCVSHCRRLYCVVWAHLPLRKASGKWGPAYRTHAHG